jgi:hypothetical protein
MGLLTLLTDPKNFKFYNGGQGYTGDGSTPNLKNLPYGNDRIYNGNSKQPYITYSIDNGAAQIKLSGTPITGLPSINLSGNIPNGLTNLDNWNNDFILRGGTRAVTDSAIDVIRLTKWFTSSTSPNGLFFTTKQNLLSRSAVHTQTSGKLLNGGVYNPLNTLLQAGVNFIGGHLNKQGLNPFRDTGISATTNENLYSVKVTPQQTKPDNRLVQLYTAVNNNLPFKLNGFTLNNGVNVLSYSGGPDSNLGVGKTNIRYINNIGRTGINNYQYTTKNTPSSYFWGTKTKQIAPNSFLTVGIVSGSTGLYKKLTKLTNTDVLLPTVVSGSNTINFGNSTYNVYDSIIEGNTWPDNTTLINVQNTYTYNQGDIINTSSSYATYKFSPQTQDFRAVLRSKIDQKGLTKETAIKAGQLTEAPDYTKYNIEQRVLLGDPGARANKNYSDYTKGVTEANGVNSIYPSSSAIGLSNDLNSSTQDYKASAGLDKINSLPVYRSQGVTTKTDLVNDLVKFRIAIIDNNKPAFKTFIHFRAFLGSISDSYNATWNPVQYLGRGENFYTYNGFTRQISLSWTTAAQSKEELIPMYKKLNYLASSLTPDYSKYGYMRGNIAQLTIGGYLYEVPGIITNLTYEMDESTPWEIGISTKLNENGKLYDSTVKELAHIVRVSSFNFIPIHRFRPETIEPGYMDGKQQFISLATAVSGDDKVNNYGVSPV